MRYALLVPLMLAGCATADPPVAPVGIRPPDPAFARECPNLEPIPVNDGTETVRARHYAQVRAAYADCKDNNAALLKYAETVSSAK